MFSDVKWRLSHLKKWSHSAKCRSILGRIFKVRVYCLWKMYAGRLHNLSNKKKNPSNSKLLWRPMPSWAVSTVWPPSSQPILRTNLSSRGIVSWNTESFWNLLLFLLYELCNYQSNSLNKLGGFNSAEAMLEAITESLRDPDRRENPTSQLIMQ